ncbi:hypothetical protein HYFRA_00004041 [Hymenoscyphus fraxineus]|uniref:Lactase n=1 Tax=Hymenoscyphus fraxineus TaxID=746836 RepID=A0A9N9KN39_9HELO|nr:hypothetical protein HYFRA_00004041 [Hymenoscyphus fraxineus]
MPDLISGIPEKDDFQNELVFERNRLPPRAYFIPKHALNLNGRWKFHYAPCPAKAPSESEDIESIEGSSTIDVPGHWQLQGHGKPHYTNVQFPFPVCPPYVPSKNPVGTYSTEFRVPSKWNSEGEMSYRLRFEGVDSAFHLSVNGSPFQARYSQGSRNPAEFDITDLLTKDGSSLNKVTVRVYQWCDGSYIEDQDQWWLSGIFRDVYFIAIPTRGHIEDFTVRTELDENYQNAQLKLDLVYSLASASAVIVKLKGQGTAHMVFEKKLELEPQSTSKTFSFHVKNPLKWTAETPALYNLSIQLGEQSEKQEPLQIIHQEVGFRQVEIKNGNLTVNGKAVLLNGANRHDHHSKYGRAVPLDFIRRDLLLMKTHNINALRCSHYPSHPEIYSMANQLGLYVMDEADLECHGFYDAVARPLEIPESKPYEERKLLTFPQSAKFTTDKESWQGAYVERMKQMVHRDKNHPSIIMWSLGNEAFYGRNHKAMYDWTRQADPTRPVHYEGDAKALSADMFSYMYLPIPELIKRATEDGDDFEKPIILCEFAHAMGTGPGALKEYHDAFLDHRRLQGGFIWEWADHGLQTTTKDGRPFFAYGGDFGDFPNDGNFVMDGLCDSEHNPRSALVETKKVFEPVRIQKVDDKLLITNLYDFVSLDHLKAHWKVSKFSTGANESILASGPLSLPEIAAGNSAIIDLPGLDHYQPGGGEIVLYISLELASSNLWAEAGHQIAWGQFPLSGIESSSTEKTYGFDSPVISTHKAILSFFTSDLNFQFDTSTDQIIKWAVRGKDIFDGAKGPQLTFWRAPTDNDIPEIAIYWALFGLDSMEKQVRSYVHTCIDGVLEITVKSWISPPILAWGFDTTTKYIVSGDGSIKIDVYAEPQGPFPTTLPRFGLEMELAKDTSTVKWYGLGPGETYRDMKQAGKLGVWAKGVDEMTTSNAFPQESGNRTDTRWIHLLNSKGTGLQAEMWCQEPFGNGSFDFNVNRHTAHELEKAKHPHELGPSDKVIFRIDGSHHGLGTASCGPPTLEQHSLKTGILDFVVVLTPIA